VPAFQPTRTERLLLRPMRLTDAPGLARRRSTPEVAAYQNWAVPFPVSRAEELIASIVDLDGPQDEDWYMIAVMDPKADEVVGDLAVHLSARCRTAEIGYTFAAEHWGKGYATEATEALVGYLFEDVGVSRVSAMLHPDNIASALVLERTGFLFEGHTRLSFWLDDENSDDWIYGMTRSDWEEWTTRTQARPEVVALVAVTENNYRNYLGVTAHKSQERFVAPVLDSIAVASFPQAQNGRVLERWMRGIEADGQAVGFAMLALSNEAHPEPHLSRFMIDRMHQRRGIGSMAISELVTALAGMGDESLRVSWLPGQGSPESFYLGQGFVLTGETLGGEVVARFEIGADLRP